METSTKVNGSLALRFRMEKALTSVSSESIGKVTFSMVFMISRDEPLSRMGMCSLGASNLAYTMEKVSEDGRTFVVSTRFCI